MSSPKEINELPPPRILRPPSTTETPASGNPPDQQKDDVIFSDSDNEDDGDSTSSTSSSKDNNWNSGKTKPKTNENESETNTTTETEPKTDPIDLIARAVAQKDEGNTFFKSGNLSRASRSYRKGTSLLKDLNRGNHGDDQVKSLLLSLQTNLSMVCFKQNKHSQSRDVACAALGVDGTNVKALYRRAVANRKLAEFDAARKDLREALKHDPENRDVQRELISIKKELERVKSRQKIGLAKAFSNKGGSFLYNDKEEEEQKKAEVKMAKKAAKKKALEIRKLEWGEESVKRMSHGEEAITFENWDKERKKMEEEIAKTSKKLEDERKQAARGSQKSKPSPPVQFSDSDSDSDLDMQQFRGYKKTSDGRTTSYFSREQTEEEKILQGNITPQRLDTTGATSGEGGGASAWNQAGTWEERNTSDWCSASLTSFLEQVLAKTDGCDGVVKEVKNLTGEASVAFVSGKKRYVFDYHANLCYNIINSDKEVLASGELHLPDISSGAVSDELEVEIIRWGVAPRDDCVELVTTCRDELVNHVRSQVLLFVSAFNSQY